MAHLSSLGAGIFTDLSMAAALAPPTDAALLALNVGSKTTFDGYFATEYASAGAPARVANGFIRLSNIREFPA